MFTKSASELFSLQGKTALITGAAAGIGEAIATRFAEAGANLVIIDKNEDGLKHLQEELAVFQTKIQSLKIDMSIREQIETLWRSLENPPEILVNNVGIYPPEDFRDLTEEFWQKVLDTNLNSTFRMCQKMIQQRYQSGGVIINIASIEAIIPFASNMVHYDTSKAGVIALTRALAKEYGARGFRINALLPGAIDTPGTREIAKRIWKQFDIGLIPTGIKFQSRLPLGRRGKPDEVACVALFLASELASYVQGAMIPVDGGFLSC
jgi:NAD(P)-dependent dehydrogenase (short-subunit alcohol dehydrogenase family)